MTAVAGEPDPFTEWDAAYVLGALSPWERHEFETHLAGCSSCQRAVAELAGLPGLLSQVPPAEVARLTGADAGPRTGAFRLDDGEELPETLLPRMLRTTRSRRRRIILVGSIAAAIVVVAGVLGALVVRGVIPLGYQEPYRVAFSEVVPTEITAVADVVPRRGGTTFKVECQYADPTDSHPAEAYAHYSIYVVDRWRGPQELKNWSAKPSRKMRPVAETPLPVWRITWLEIRETDSGAVLLRAPLR